MSLMIAALLLTAPATEPAAPAPASPPPAETKKPKKICKADDTASGSRMTKRLCLTEEEWAQRSHSMTESARSGFSGKAEDH